MASAPAAPSVPPKFVPTLTEEVSLPVQPDDAFASPDEVPGGYELPAGAAFAASAPPLDVSSLPVLTEIADVPSEPAAADNADADVVPPAPSSAEEAADLQMQPAITDTATVTAVASLLPDGYEEIVVHRVMQRVDVLLEQRLREAIATVIQEQTRSIVPRLREEVESVVRQSVYEAVADELATHQK